MHACVFVFGTAATALALDLCSPQTLLRTRLLTRSFFRLGSKMLIIFIINNTWSSDLYAVFHCAPVLPGVLPLRMYKWAQYKTQLHLLMPSPRPPPPQSTEPHLLHTSRGGGDRPPRLEPLCNHGFPAQCFSDDALRPSTSQQNRGHSPIQIDLCPLIPCLRTCQDNHGRTAL